VAFCLGGSDFLVAFFWLIKEVLKKTFAFYILGPYIRENDIYKNYYIDSCLFEKIHYSSEFKKFCCILLDTLNDIKK